MKLLLNYFERAQPQYANEVVNWGHGTQTEFPGDQEGLKLQLVITLVSYICIVCILSTFNVCGTLSLPEESIE